MNAIFGRRAFHAAGLLAGAALGLAGASFAASKADYPGYGGDQGATRYSELTQITKANVGKLVQAWRFDMPAGGAAMTVSLHYY